MSPSLSTSRVALQRSFGADGGGRPSWAADPPHRQLGSGLWAICAESSTPLRHCALRSNCFAASCKERPFLDHSTGTSPGSPPGPGPERRERLVRLSGWTQRNSCRGSEQRTRPPTSARSARSSRWSTTCSRSGRGCSCPTRPSGRERLESSRWLGARRFPSGRRQSRASERPQRRSRWRRTVLLAGLVFAAGAASGGFFGRKDAASPPVPFEAQVQVRTVTRATDTRTHPRAAPTSTRGVVRRPRQRGRAARPAANVLGVTTAVSKRGVQLDWQRPLDSDHVAVIRARGAQQIESDRLPRPRDELPRRVCSPAAPRTATRSSTTTVEVALRPACRRQS